MAQFNGMTLTNKGRTIIAKALTGKELKFTRCIAGNGYLPEAQDPAELTDIITRCCNMQIDSVEITPYVGTAKVAVSMSNKELQAGFFLREIGLFANDPDTHEEVLYGYSNSGDTADFMPGTDGPDAVYYRFDLTVIIEQAQNVTAIFSDNPLAVTHTQLETQTDIILKYINDTNKNMQAQINILADGVIRGLLQTGASLNIFPVELEVN